MTGVLSNSTSQTTALPAQSKQARDMSVASHHPLQNSHFHNLAVEIYRNLQHQHGWSDLRIHNLSPLTSEPLPRPMVSGLPPRRVYVHPDDQVEEIKLGLKEADAVVEREWVLPARLREKWSLRRFGEVFDVIGAEPPVSGEGIQGLLGEVEARQEGNKRDEVQEKHNRRAKRLLLATAADDSTVVYYIVHDGIVKPRQN